jgi:hypothetical protein
MTYDCTCDYEMPSVVRNRNVKRARKHCRCEECGRDIEAGDPYRNIWGVWDGISETHVMCRHCADLNDWALISVPCFCWCYGTLHEDIRNMVEEVRRDVPGFFFEYGRKMVALKRAGARI